MTPLELFCGIIQREMDLASDQVYIYNQKIDIPPDERLYVAVGILSVKPFSNTKIMVPTSTGLEEQLSTNVQTTLSLDIFSRGDEARDRKEEVVLALHSTFSELTQNNNGFYIAPITSSFVNLSQLEGSAINNRFNISVNVQSKVSKTRAVPYYDVFTHTSITDP